MMMTMALRRRTTPSFGWRRLLQRLTKLADWIDDYLDDAYQRRQLASLDDRLLKDIGLSRADAERIAAVPRRRRERRCQR